MFKVLLMAFLVWNGQLIKPPIAMGLPDLEYTSMVECDAAVATDEFREAATEMFANFLKDKSLPPDASVAVAGSCMPAADADAAVATLGQPI